MKSAGYCEKTIMSEGKITIYQSYSENLREKPYVRLQVESDHSNPVRIQLRTEFPETVSCTVGFHPCSPTDQWLIGEDTIQFTGEIAPRGSLQTVYGLEGLALEERHRPIENLEVESTQPIDPFESLPTEDEFPSDVDTDTIWSDLEEYKPESGVVPAERPGEVDQLFEKLAQSDSHRGHRRYKKVSPPSTHWPEE